MRNIPSIIAATIISTLGFACASTESLGQEGFFDFPMTVEGSTVDDLLSDRERIEQTLNTLLEIDVVDQRAQAIELLQGLDEGRFVQDQVPLALRGIGSFGVRLLARSYFFGEVQKVQGKIRDYVYDEGTKGGHLAVDVRTLIFTSAKDRDLGKPPIRTELLHWDIDVDGVYEVHSRGLDFLDPFPDVDLALPGYAIASIWIRDLRYKLHAKGTGIVVRHIYRKIDDNPIELLPTTDPLYASTDASCIDLLFHPYPPELELPPQIGYCLGRCDHPAIVNTGG
jgi:hypothetical protein